MAGQGSLQDLKELFEPIKDYVRGICVTYHGSPKDEEAVYLEQNVGEGRVLYIPYSGRHDHSRNCYLYNGVIKQGDWCLQFDVLERVNPEFLLGLPLFLSHWEKQGANAIFYYGKPLLFKYHESMFYRGFPHESLQRGDGHMRAVEISDAYPNEADIRLNVRPQKRSPEHFIKHYARYSLMPWGANHYALGLENKPNAQKLFVEREIGRLKFIELLRELNIERDVDAVIEYMRAGGMDQRIRAHVSQDKIWNDVYRYYVLGRFDFKDDHDWSNLVEVPL